MSGCSRVVVSHQEVLSDGCAEKIEVCVNTRKVGDEDECFVNGSKRKSFFFFF